MSLTMAFRSEVRADMDYLPLSGLSHHKRTARAGHRAGRRADQPFWAVRPESSGLAQGWLSLCDIYPADGQSRSAALVFAVLQRTRAATEAIFLLMQYAMDELKYPRPAGLGAAVLAQSGISRRIASVAALVRLQTRAKTRRCDLDCPSAG